MTHLFERQGFGPGPYLYKGCEERTTHTVAQDAGRDLGFFPEAPRAAGTCDSCGQCIRYVYFLESANGTDFGVGCDCVLKAFAESLGDPVAREVKRAARDFASAARRASKARREKVQKRARLRLFVTAAGRELLADLKVSHRIIEDIRARLIQWGSVSDKQVALVAKLAREAREKALLPPEVHVPVPMVEGRIRIEGEIVSVKGHESDYGWSLKMTVKVDTGEGTYLVWGSVPAALEDAWAAENRAAGGDGQYSGNNPLRGRRVAFMAKVVRSDRDDHFGFFKRPTKPALLV